MSTAGHVAVMWVCGAAAIFLTTLLIVESFL